MRYGLSVLNRRQRPVMVAVAAIALVWFCAVAGYRVARNARMTADKVQAYLHSIQLSRLSGEARARAIRELTAKLNALSPDERRKARVDREWRRWFTEMTGEEKGTFIEATAPAGFKQMLTAFEELPAEKRRKAIDDALKRLKAARENDGHSTSDPSADPDGGTNRAPVMSEELRQRATTIGLKTFYSQSSAETKAELAPVLEEIQRMMENGALFRERR